ncbi:hypothetical protein SAMN05216464_103430 [Mucilaginibacter pineti]|uniref:Uncharacterized protein n=1 Tax=Mucilaginibacter pineti TaxID=1391627 RepID=A0A1G6ZNW4_9SPHI|nr:hypothetical protein [Mucilaginibacter pineti]SDE04073.1 hypothetical protein SAMN05216464_103430 [Mucilaginibacter pineti]
MCFISLVVNYGFCLGLPFTFNINSRDFFICWYASWAILSVNISPSILLEEDMGAAAIGGSFFSGQQHTVIAATNSG